MRWIITIIPILIRILTVAPQFIKEGKEALASIKNLLQEIHADLHEGLSPEEVTSIREKLVKVGDEVEDILALVGRVFFGKKG